MSNCPRCQIVLGSPTSYTYTQVMDIITIGVIFINLIIIICIIIVDSSTLTFMIIITIITKGSHTEAAVAVEMMLDLR